jgi:hypothetical protein
MKAAQPLSSAPDILALLVVYDLRDPVAWQAARCHRGVWGKAYTDILSLDYDHIALVFRSADERWQVWESVRLGWILEELQESEAA